MSAHSAESAFVRSFRTARPSLTARLGRKLADSLKGLAHAPRRWAVERELGQLSDRELADIGITRADLPFVLRRARGSVAGPVGFPPRL